MKIVSEPRSTVRASEHERVKAKSKLLLTHLKTYKKKRELNFIHCKTDWMHLIPVKNKNKANYEFDILLKMSKHRKPAFGEMTKKTNK